MDDLAESKVLIVDDMAGNRFLLSRVLDEYHTFEAENGAEALQIVAEKSPDIILLDIQMPGIDGFEVCKRLKSSPATSDIPIIFITGNDTPGLAGKCLEIGAVDFITKPFDLGEIGARVRTHLTLRKTTAELLRQNKLLEERIKEQRLNSQLARKVLELVDFPARRNINLSDNIYMVNHVLACACNDEGGDHYLIKTMPALNGGKKTMVSIKDQSGHSVNCILRSIITDLLHNSILYTKPNLSLQENVTLLNNAIFSTGLFEGDDFFTALFLEVDHQSKRLDFVAAGHPSFFLIRNGKVEKIPEKGGDGANLPLGFQENISFQSGEMYLVEGDRLILYTDGLTEMPMICKNKALQTSDLQEVLQRIVDSNEDISVSALMSKLPTAVMQKGTMANCDDFIRHLHDDVTMVGLQIAKIEGGSWKTFVPADYEGIDGLVEAVFSFLRDAYACAGFAFDEFKARMVLIEGIINAWKHGNKCDGDKSISIGWQLHNDFSVFIQDQGDGFDYKQLRNPARLGNRLFENGRGIFCMKKYAEYVGWQDGGRTLVLSFKLQTHSWEQIARPPGALIDLWKDPLPNM